MIFRVKTEVLFLNIKNFRHFFVFLFSEKRLPFIPFRRSPFNCTLREAADIKVAN